MYLWHKLSAQRSFSLYQEFLHESYFKVAEASIQMLNPDVFTGVCLVDLMKLPPSGGYSGILNQTMTAPPCRQVSGTAMQPQYPTPGSCTYWSWVDTIFSASPNPAWKTKTKNYFLVRLPTCFCLCHAWGATHWHCSANPFRRNQLGQLVSNTKFCFAEPVFEVHVERWRQVPDWRHVTTQVHMTLENYFNEFDRRRTPFTEPRG